MKQEDLYDEIISVENISKAYFNIIQKFYEESKPKRYFGFDGKNLKSYSENSDVLIQEIRQEMIDLKPISPALIVKIPKKNKSGLREISIHNVKERIKNQAIYQIIEPVVDKILSTYLFSYRYSHPHYLAIKSVAKRYRKNYKNESVLVGDIKDYSDNMNHDFLISEIKKINFDKKTEELIFLFIEKRFLIKGITHEEEIGIITSLPTTVMCCNLYLNEMDKKIGQSAKLYRRVGDDFIIFDSAEKIEKHRENLEQELINAKLLKQEQKIKIQPASEPFSFLGYKFENGKISILEQTVKTIKKRYRYRLKFYPTKTLSKKKKLEKILYKEDAILYDFLNTINAYNQINDSDQIKELSEYFFIRLVIYFFGKYNQKNKRLTLELTRDMKIPSLWKCYNYFHTGKYTLAEMRNNTNWIK
jgi:retron-type reverse transcriptase